jgi:dTDP-4-dehydrorhamnose 3,5-epimerase
MSRGFTADSLTFRKWEAFERRVNLRQLYAPGGIAHGFQCLSDDCEVYYQMSEFYEPELARGVRWNDPTLSISWPVPNSILSDRDRSLPPLGAS